MSVDLSKLVTAEELAAQAAARRAKAIKAEVQARIFAVVDQNTQASLLAAMVAGALTSADETTFADGQAWIEATKQAGRDAVSSGDDPIWPAVPAGVAELAAQF
ncbi:hypothetical protein SAMN05216376_12064 [Mameliella alba]|uniref:hypothetical protein n=1 Tax=Mameliella alba TaxID=561184 RepID=UPI000882704E|nr:hypothetical protein [Mameliella alba]OWV41877.1 hypothetical protein CDZ96_24375 [Mameliella alba]PTR35563.1 hypothetical protein LX94_04749 [Mameliella alba]GGF82955.1 hypothetical protein GCM10011319_48710 [Mameliella alba]SDE19926.1 hypothetical protein SAMN05216376_12064 [Mameliella alba]